MRPTRASRARALQWSRTALTIGLLFASLPLVWRILFGVWGFTGAGELGCLLLMAAVYLYLVSRRMPAWRDAAELLQQAGELAAAGRSRRAIALLSTAIRQNARVWQALQYRAQLYLEQGDTARALADLSEAARLAPAEPELIRLRDQVRSLLPDSRS